MKARAYFVGIEFFKFRNLDSRWNSAVLARFVNRAIELKKSIDSKYKSSGHEFGVRFKEIIENLEIIPDQLRYENLFIELIVSDNPAEEEKYLLNSYFERFGELPPFNRVS